ncbi:MAG: hypothetical protein AAFU71_18510, partial [Cyanobacteria bacterium J06632_22]
MDETQTRQLKAYRGTQPLIEVFSAAQLRLQFKSYHYEARNFDGGETYHFKVLEMRSRSHRLLKPVWAKDWTEI